jgi:hypothetical protein
MKGPAVVFLGPTLPVEVARAVFDAVYLPPAEQGSVVRAVLAYRPRLLVLIDGAFARRPALRHKELLWALAAGVEVWGASSMGALRAAELAGTGMRGHGLVYRWYRATPMADDGEVAVAMAPAELGSAALSVALIDIRLTLRHAERAGVIGREVRSVMLALARAQYFTERGYAALVEACRAGRPDLAAQSTAFADWVTAHAVDRKADDAVGLLRHLAGRPPPAASRPRPFTMTEDWACDLEAASLWRDLLAFAAPPEDGDDRPAIP